MRAVWPTLVVVTLVGCGSSSVAHDAGASAEFALAWTVRSEHWGTEAILVKKDGRARYMVDPPPGADGARLRGELRLTRAELDALGDLLAQNHVCNLRPSGRAGRENESRPTLDIDVPGARCTVTMWFDEWRTSPAAMPSAAAIAHLRERLRQTALQ